jgi:hypothetical protein
MEAIKPNHALLVGLILICAGVFYSDSCGTDTRSLQAYLGHKNIHHTVRYCEISPTRFNDLWRD